MWRQLSALGSGKDTDALGSIGNVVELNVAFIVGGVGRINHNGYFIGANISVIGEDESPPNMEETSPVGEVG